MSYYVKREHRETGRIGFVGPIRSLKQADKEVHAWLSCGTHKVWLLESSPEVRAEVRSWNANKPVFAEVTQ
jgi:hypothetical protein